MHSRTIRFAPRRCATSSTSPVSSARRLRSSRLTETIARRSRSSPPPTASLISQASASPKIFGPLTLPDGRLAHRLHVFRQRPFDDARSRLLDIERHIDFDAVKAGQLEVKAEFKKLTKFRPESALIPLRFYKK